MLVHGAKERRWSDPVTFKMVSESLKIMLQEEFTDFRVGDAKSLVILANS